MGATQTGITETGIASTVRRFIEKNYGFSIDDSIVDILSTSGFQELDDDMGQFANCSRVLKQLDILNTEGNNFQTDEELIARLFLKAYMYDYVTGKQDASTIGTWATDLGYLEHLLSIRFESEDSEEGDDLALNLVEKASKHLVYAKTTGRDGSIKNRATLGKCCLKLATSDSNQKGTYYGLAHTFFAEAFTAKKSIKVKPRDLALMAHSAIGDYIYNGNEGLYENAINDFDRSIKALCEGEFDERAARSVGYHMRQAYDILTNSRVRGLSEKRGKAVLGISDIYNKEFLPYMNKNNSSRGLKRLDFK